MRGRIHMATLKIVTVTTSDTLTSLIPAIEKKVRTATISRMARYNGVKGDSC